jgi:hypothetical protein
MSLMTLAEPMWSQWPWVRMINPISSGIRESRSMALRKPLIIPGDPPSIITIPSPWSR